MGRLSLVLISVFLAVNLYASSENLHGKFESEPSIEIYLESVTNGTDNPLVDVETFKKVFKRTVENRRRVKFAVVDSREKADVIITAHIEKYEFTENAMPFMFSTASLAADTLAPKSSARLVVDYEVRSPKDDKAILRYENFATEERRPRMDMKGDNAFIYSIDENVNKFVVKAFHKPKSNL